MARTQNEGLAFAPDFTPHRVAVKAADPAVPTASIKKAHGMVSDQFDEVVAEVYPTGGTTSVTVEVLFWSDLANSFVKQATPVTFAGIATASPRQIRFTTGGQRFFLHVTGTIDAAGQVDISCAGVPMQGDQMA